MQYIFPCLALVLPFNSFASDASGKQWFNSAGYSYLSQKAFRLDVEGIESLHFPKKTYHSKGFSSTYYFAPQQSTGVWDDYGYLTTDSNVSINYADSYTDNVLSIGGRAHVNDWFVSAHVYDLSRTGYHAIGFGYSYNDSLQVSMTSQRSSHRSDDVSVGASYNHQINNFDYFGVSVSLDDNADDWSISGRYFKKLEGGQHVAIDVAHAYIAHAQDSSTQVTVSYYINESWGFAVSPGDSSLEFEAKFFFSDKYYVVASYDDGDSSQITGITFNANF